MKKAYLDHNYIVVGIHRHEEDGRVASEAMDCRMLLRMQDINGNIILKKLFGITGFDGGKSVLLDGDIFDDMRYRGNGIYLLVTCQK